MSLLGSSAEWLEEARALGRFATALTPDIRFAREPAAAAVLVDTLVNRALLAARNGEGPPDLCRRARLLSLFVRFHRRHVRLKSVDDDGAENDGGREGALVERVICAMPLELREALLLVVLERLPHTEAAAVLEISLAALIDRLARARLALSRAVATPIQARSPRRSGAPHLRLVK
ncbi:MAG TPA: sigma factor-like helix-turn-helix DNA-binding protein [Roseiarcus sp.]|jgi:hypothetical protein|nr:sigma factor-like helix-turn-helix DNA-binding protein [Roseiarcus sp.]